MVTQSIMEDLMKIITGGWYRDKNPPSGTDVYTLIHRIKEDHLLISELVYVINMGYQCNRQKRVICNQEMQSWIDQRKPELVKDEQILKIINTDHKLHI